MNDTHKLMHIDSALELQGKLAQLPPLAARTDEASSYELTRQFGFLSGQHISNRRGIDASKHLATFIAGFRRGLGSITDADDYMRQLSEMAARLADVEQS